MTKQIEDYTVDELSAKINAIKAERERTANALKRYEEELKVRKRDVSLGVPQEGLFFVDTNSNVDKRYGLFSLAYVDYNCFLSKESAEKHAEMLLAWRKALVENSKGEPIDIKVLFPLLKKGYVAMDEDKNWYWHPVKPKHDSTVWIAEKPGAYLLAFNIKPAENWETSLMECRL